MNDGHAYTTADNTEKGEFNKNIRKEKKNNNNNETNKNMKKRNSSAEQVYVNYVKIHLFLCKKKLIRK